MNHKTSIVFHSFLLSFLSLSATTFYLGRAHLNNVTYKESVNVNGRLSFENLKIKGTLSVNGRVNGDHLQADKVDINGRGEIHHATLKEAHFNGRATLSKLTTPLLKVCGKCNLENSTVSQLLDVTGKLQTKNVTLAKAILSTNFCMLEDTLIEHDLIINVSTNSLSFMEWLFGYRNASNTIAEVELRGTTHIKGNIIFKNGQGKVRCTSKVKISGNVQDGTIIQL